MHSFDSYHSRWFPLWCLWGLSIFFMLTLLPSGTALPAALRAGLMAGTLLMLIRAGVLLQADSSEDPSDRPSRLRTWLISTLGFVITAAGSLISEGTSGALISAAGTAVLIALLPLTRSGLIPDTGDPAGEWIAGALIAAGLGSADRTSAVLLTGSAALRFLFGLMYSIVPVRLERTSNEILLHRASWVPAAAAVAAAGLIGEDSPALRLTVWAALAARAAWHLGDGFRRLDVLAGLVPRGSRKGLFRSFLIYHRIPFRASATRRFYATFASPRGRAWDIGAHLGNRCRCWLNLGLKVTAFEPQPSCANLLENWFGNSPRFSLHRSAAGAEHGVARLHVSGLHPTLASVSAEWVDRMGRQPAFDGIQWNESVSVPVVPLRELEALDGPPDILKVDVEGFEAAVLAGTDPLPAMLSFEVLPSDKENAFKCIHLLTSRHRWQWNLVLKERFRFHFSNPITTQTLVDTINGMAETGPSGDIYGWKLE